MSEEFENAVFEHLGPKALLGESMSLHEAFSKGWQAARELDAKRIAELESQKKAMREVLGAAQDELIHLSHHTREDYARNCANELFNNIEQALALKKEG